MLHHSQYQRIRRLMVLIIAAAVLLSPIHAPAQVTQAAPTALQDLCGINSTGPGWYTRIATQALYTPSNNWDIYLTDPCYPRNDRMRLTTSPAFDGYPRLNTDATRIVFVSERDGNQEIYTMNADGSGQARLTTSTAVDTAPVFSPDGSRIAFVSARDGNPEIYVMNADGSGQTRLTSNTVQDYDPDWSPDGQLLAWAQGTSTSRQVFTMKADGSGATPLSAPFKNARRPVWSPWGDRLALEGDANNDGWQDLIEISADGSGSLVLPVAKTVTASYGEDFLMGGWLTDGSALVFTRAAYNVSGTARTLKSAVLTQTTLTGLVTIVDDVTDPSFYPAVRPSDPYPPTTTIQPLPKRTRNQTIRWTASDTGTSGLYGYALERRTLPDGDWVTICEPCTIPADGTPSFWSGSYSVSLTSGVSMAFRVRAWDKAGNETTYPAETETTMYYVKMDGVVTDTRQVPLPAVQVQAGSGMAAPVATDAQGKASVFFTSGGPVKASFNAAGYGAYPAQTWPLAGDGTFRAVVPPAQNLLVNGDFEAPESSLSGWQASGDLPVQPGEGLSGYRAARLGGQCDNRLCFTPLEAFLNQDEIGKSLVTTSDGVTHFLALFYKGSGHYDIQYFTHPRDGTWSAAQVLADASKLSRMRVSRDGTLYFTYFDSTSLPVKLARKMLGGDWLYESIPSVSPSAIVYDIAVDPQNGLHLVFNQDSETRYMHRLSDGSWVGPFALPIARKSPYNSLYFALGAGPDGTVHLVYQEATSSYPYYSYLPFYAQLSADGQMTHVQELPSFYPALGYWDEFVLDSILVSANGDLHVLATDLYDSRAVYWKRAADGAWSDPAVMGGDHNQEYEMVAGPTGDAMVFGEQNFGTGVYVYYRPAGSGYFTRWQADLGLDYNRLIPALDERGQLQLVVSGSNEGKLYFTRLAPPAVSGQAAIQQTVTVPADLPNPTLSFQYKLEQEFPGPDSAMQVSLTPAGGSPTPLVTARAESGIWAHEWVDLSAWAGQTVTLTFAMHQAAGEWYARLLLDEISLGGWNTPVVQAMAPEMIPAAEAASTPLRLSGVNLSAGAQVFVGDQPAAQVTVDEATGDLIVQLPPDLLPGRHLVRVLYPDGRAALSPRALQIGSLYYLPTVGH